MVVGWTGSLIPSGSVSPRARPARRPPPASQAEAVGPVVAAAERVDLGRAAELAAAEDDRPVERSALLEVADQGAQGGVKVLDAAAVDLVIVDMRVPAVERHLDAADADLGEPAGGQAAAAEGGVAIVGSRAGPALARRRTP